MAISFRIINMDKSGLRVKQKDSQAVINYGYPAYRIVVKTRTERMVGKIDGRGLA
jgi:hypothetical protein